jgi:hypothetical protein
MIFPQLPESSLANAMTTPTLRFGIRARLVHLATLGKKRVERAALRFSQGLAAPTLFSPRIKEAALEPIL